MAEPWLIVEKPYAVAVTATYMEDRVCFSCLKPYTSLPCPHCKMAFYCSKECQLEDITTGQHTWECEAWRKLDPKTKQILPLFQEGRLVARICSRYALDQGDGEPAILMFPEKVKKRKLTDLMSMTEEWTGGENAKKFDLFEKRFRILYGQVEGLSKVTTAQLKTIYGAVFTNAFTVGDFQALGLDLAYGIGIYLQVSRIDHSCKPNLVRHFDGSTVKVKLLFAKKIGKKMKIEDQFISYYPGFNAGFTEERRRVLKKNFLFDCNCELCVDKEEDLKRRFSINKQCEKCKNALVFLDDEEKPQFKCLDCKNTVVDLNEKSAAIFRRIFAQLKPQLFLFEEKPVFDDDDLASVNLAGRMLHPVRNVHLLRLREKIAACLPKSEGLVPKFTNLPENGPCRSLADCVELYESILKSFAFYKVHSTSHPVFAAVLGKLYTAQGEHATAKMWFMKSRDLWLKIVGDQHRCVRETQILIDESANIMKRMLAS